MEKTYSNQDITVVWKPDLCIHSTKCWKGLISVFNPKNRPWVNLDGASTETIIKQIDACPSQALSYSTHNTVEDTPMETQVEVMKNGPLLVKGNVIVEFSNGEKETKNKITAFCRCGLSQNKPFCDGSHQKNNWKDA